MKRKKKCNDKELVQSTKVMPSKQNGKQAKLHIDLIHDKENIWLTEGEQLFYQKGDNAILQKGVKKSQSFQSVSSHVYLILNEWEKC